EESPGRGGLPARLRGGRQGLGRGRRGDLAQCGAGRLGGPGRAGGEAMKVSFFETARYRAPEDLPPEWPVPSGVYDPETGARAYQDMIERLKFVEELGFDWVSVSEHHYSPRILTPSPMVSASYIAARLSRIKIALLGPIVPQSNPV